MFVIIEKFPINTALFRNCIINERLNLVYFIHRPMGMEGEIQLPVLFENTCEARRFYTEYHNALHNDLFQYEFIGEAWFSLELYIRLRDGYIN